MDKKTRCGVVAIIGEPNAGKSTLINALAGGKVSIVTPKVQTTRFNVRGVCNYENTQFIFVDTPGIFNPEKRFEKAMVSAAWAGIGDADAVLMILDAEHRLRESSKQLIEKLKSVKDKPVFLAINKIDLIAKEALLALIKECDEYGVFLSIFMISALKGDGIDYIKAMLATSMPEGPFHYPEDQMSDISLRLLAAEITREKLFMMLDQELPYSILVETEKWEETENPLPRRGRARVGALSDSESNNAPLPTSPLRGEGIFRISQVIYVQREGQKKIVIGEKGAMIKRIGMSARIELEKIVGRKLHLELFVKVKPDWKDDRESYRLLGLEFK